MAKLLNKTKKPGLARAKTFNANDSSMNGA